LRHARRSSASRESEIIGVTVLERGARSFGSSSGDLKPMNDSRDVWQLVDAKQKPLIELSDRIWSMPELCYAETRSSAEHLAELERHGFRVTKNVAGIPT